MKNTALINNIGLENELFCFETAAATMRSRPFMVVTGIASCSRDEGYRISHNEIYKAVISYVTCLVHRIDYNKLLLEPFMTDHFEYEPFDLDQPGFRLLRLEGGNGPLRCHVFQAYLNIEESLIPYEALSYCWGTDLSTDTIVVNGKLLFITSNLSMALKHLRFEKRDRILWIDAICVDQGNARERGHQVSWMGDIFSRAEEVLIWLGYAGYNVTNLMSALKSFEANVPIEAWRQWPYEDSRYLDIWKNVADPVAGQNSSDIDQQSRLKFLMNNEWFGRVWIVQEVAKAKRASLGCSEGWINARTFALAPRLLGVDPSTRCQAIIDVMPGPSRKSSWWSQNPNLSTLLWKFRESQASDPRDRLYALLGIASNNKTDRLIVADYSKTEEAIVKDIIAHLFDDNIPMNDSHTLTIADLQNKLPSLSYVALERMVLDGVNADDMRLFIERQNRTVLLLELIKNRPEYRPDILKLLLEKGADIRAHDGDYSNALQAASREGYKRVARMLLDKGADVNAQGGDYINALIAASEGRYMDVVQKLPDKDACVNSEAGRYNNALIAASEGGHLEVVQMLLDKGVNVNTESEKYVSALIAASKGGHLEVVNMLLDKGNNINTERARYGIALRAASEGGHKEVVQMLLTRGADINGQGERYGSALHAASIEGHLEVVQMLLDRGANINTESERYGSALYAASVKGHLEVVQMLLDKGNNFNTERARYGIALRAASEGGHKEVVQMLLDKGANVNMESERYGNALYAASVKGHLEVIQMLLDKGTNDNTDGGDYGNALIAASGGGHKGVVQMLLAKGADVNAQGGDYGYALHAASRGGHLEVVQMLLDKGANVNAQGGDYGNALIAASEGGHKEVARMLLTKEADVNGQGERYGSALHAASREGHLEVVQMLLDKGANVNAQDERSGSALIAASIGRHSAVVKMLLAKRADVNDAR